MPDFTDHLKPAHDGTATLQAERDGSAVNAMEFAIHLLGRDGFLERQERVLKILKKEKLFNKDQQLNLSRPERYHLGLARAKAIQRIIRREGWNREDYTMAEYLNDEMSPYFLHMSMFGGPPCFLCDLGVKLTPPSCNSHYGQGTGLKRTTRVLDAQDPQLRHHWLLRSN